MNIVSIIGIAIISASIIVFIRKNVPEFAVPVSVVASLIILVVSILFAVEIFEKIEEISSFSSVSSGNIKTIFKTLGVCYITQIGRDVCNDCGETALGDKVDLAGKIIIAAMSLNIITQVLEMITELIKI